MARSHAKHHFFTTPVACFLMHGVRMFKSGGVYVAILTSGSSRATRLMMLIR